MLLSKAMVPPQKVQKIEQGFSVVQNVLHVWETRNPQLKNKVIKQSMTVCGKVINENNKFKKKYLLLLIKEL